MGLTTELESAAAHPGSETGKNGAAKNGFAHESGSEAWQSSEKCQTYFLAARVVDQHLLMLQKRDLREMSKALGAPPSVVQVAIDLIRSLDPRPGRRYNRSDARLIEPDVAFVKHGDDYVVAMNEEDMPTLRLNQGYRKLLSQDGTEKEVRDYVKERYRSALQLMRNIEQRKNTILRTCEAIVRRQREFLERGVEALKPMMIKDVAEEIGVHPSTVSRAVFEQVRPYFPGSLRAALLLLRGGQRAGGQRHAFDASQAQGEKANRRRRSPKASH